ncbi:MAG: hypothetical protein KUG71_00610 [Porticoccaceae bacterium]|nr:hypothetical protein [Porticoccaceae bacterium]
MTFSANELRHFIIRETLKELGDWSLDRENLLLGTAAQESGLGQNLKEGRLAGIYHISPAAHRAVWDKYLINQPELASTIRGLAGQRSFLKDPNGELISNLKYATAIAWLIYKRTDKELPQRSSLEDLARFWHRHFHTRASGQIEDFVISFRGMVLSTPSLVA